MEIGPDPYAVGFFDVGFKIDGIVWKSTRWGLGSEQTSFKIDGIVWKS